jgi:hypothetical protein
VLFFVRAFLFCSSSLTILRKAQLYTADMHALLLPGASFMVRSELVKQLMFQLLTCPVPYAFKNHDTGSSSNSQYSSR